MTRDEIALAVAPALVARLAMATDIAKAAYAIADAMLLQRKEDTNDVDFLQTPLCRLYRRKENGERSYFFEQHTSTFLSRQGIVTVGDLIKIPVAEWKKFHGMKMKDVFWFSDVEALFKSHGVTLLR